MLADVEAVVGSAIEIIHALEASDVISVVVSIVVHIVGSSGTDLSVGSACIELGLRVRIAVCAVKYDAQAIVVGKLQFEERLLCVATLVKHIIVVGSGVQFPSVIIQSLVIRTHATQYVLAVLADDVAVFDHLIVAILVIID